MNRKHLIFALVATLSMPAVADETADTSDWEFELSPLFLWGMGISGDSQIGTAVAPLDIEFKDVLQNLEAVLTVHFEARKDKWTFFTEYQYANMDPSAEVQGSPAKIDVDYKNTMWELGAAYQVAQYEKTDIELLFGARYTEQQNKTRIKNGPTLVDVDEAWWDGFVGGRTSTRLSDKWHFVARADVGAGGSDLVWNLVGFFDYRFKEWGSVFFGYKWLDYDYDNGKKGANAYTFDAIQQGPLAGINFHW